MKRFLAFFLFLILGFTAQAEGTEEPKNLYAQAAVLMDAESGRILYEKNGKEVLAMASTTKIMTCILALENGKTEDIVTASANAASQPKVHLGMIEGEQFYLKDLLYSLMLESHNDSAVAIAEHLAGSVEAFADMMNAKAKELGCGDTYFITPNGLDAVDEKGSHSTTAADLARIMSYCVSKSPKKEAFLDITAMPSYSFSNVQGNRTFGCTNHNSFLSMMEGAISGKTGFTGKAGYCYVGAVERDGRTFVVALLACGWPNNKTYKWQDTKKLMEYAIENYEYRSVDGEIQLPEVQVKGGIPDNGSIYASAYIELRVDTGEENGVNLLLRDDEEVKVVTEYEESLNAPIEAGTKVGTVSYYLEDEKIKEYPIVAGESVEKKTLQWYWSAMLKIYLL